MNPSMDRWIVASLAEHFSSLSEHLHVQGKRRQTDALDKWFELRVWRIMKNQRTKTEWHISVEIDVACMAIHSTNAYHVNDMSGEAASKFDTSIPLYQYDEELTLPATQLSCFDRATGPNILALGEIKPDIRLYQTNVTGKYEVKI